MLTWIAFILLSFFIAVSSLISAAEIGITSLTKYRIKKIMAQRPSLAKPLLLWLESPHYLLTVILTINVIADMLVSFLSTFFLTEVFYQLNRIIVEISAWFFTSFVLLIIGEIVPKIYARANSEKVTVKAVPILSKIEKIAKPFLFPIIKITEFLSPKTCDIYSQGLSKDEIQTLLSEGASTQAIDNETSGMLERTLGFGDLSVKRIMTPFAEIESVDLSLDEEKFLDRAVETARSRIPVYMRNKENIIGYVHIKDILWAWKENKGHFVRAIVNPPYYIGENKKINDLLKEFQSGKTHIAFVKDASENITGMATLEDILEEVVGEIIDEYEFER
ncbi:MAG: hemolysin family protein [Endomicrobium sp.]|jgi:CBS domain containing-hemolysin-like protein|nr:hemolysin family protein [Endomicrobium sp.]